jgi:hypothetical protein
MSFVEAVFAAMSDHRMSLTIVQAAVPRRHRFVARRADGGEG